MSAGTKVHNEARRFAGQGLQILLIGHAGHEEVEGTSGEAPEHITLVQHPDDVDSVELGDPSKVAWLSQTTLSVDETWETVDRLREKFPALMDPPSDDICYATQNRQSAVKQIATHSDLVIVVGSKNSSNSVRLVEVALEAGAKASYRVDNAGEIDEAWLRGVDSVGVTSGASVPDARAGVLDFLRVGVPRRGGGTADRGEPGVRPASGASQGPAAKDRRRLTPQRRDGVGMLRSARSATGCEVAPRPHAPQRWPQADLWRWLDRQRGRSRSSLSVSRGTNPGLRCGSQGGRRSEQGGGTGFKPETDGTGSAARTSKVIGLESIFISRSASEFGSPSSIPTNAGPVSRLLRLTYSK